MHFYALPSVERGLVPYQFLNVYQMMIAAMKLKDAYSLEGKL